MSKLAQARNRIDRMFSQGIITLHEAFAARERLEHEFIILREYKRIKGGLVYVRSHKVQRSAVENYEDSDVRVYEIQLLESK